MVCEYLLKLVVGITGSTGVIYGIRLLETLKKIGIESHLIMSEWACKMHLYGN